jgi:hypothetical protein
MIIWVSKHISLPAHQSALGLDRLGSGLDKLGVPKPGPAATAAQGLAPAAE